MRRVVVTGLGAVTPLGGNVSATWKNILDSRSGVIKINHFDSSELTCQIAGMVPGPDAKDGFDYEKYVSSKDIRKMDQFIVYGLAAGIQAIEDSGWMPEDEHDQDMTGVMIGSGIGGLRTIEETSIMISEKGVRRVSPFFIPASLINLASGHLSIKYNFRGPNHAVVTACSTGAHAIGDAARIIACGDANVMVAGGAEAAVCKTGMAGFASARALSTSYNDSPEIASRPWDEKRDGFVMGEGSGVVVLEEYEHAKKRGAKIYCEVVGYGLTGDGYHITSPHPEGKGAFRAMEMALKKSGLEKSDIGYVNAHATSTPVGDSMELNNVAKFFANDLDKISMSSTKSAMGHLLGAAGSVEAILSILAMQDGILPPTLNLDNPPADNKIDLVPHKAKEKKVSAVMSNSFGFGGTNATLIMKKI